MAQIIPQKGMLCNRLCVINCFYCKKLYGFQKPSGTHFLNRFPVASGTAQERPHEPHGRIHHALVVFPFRPYERAAVYLPGDEPVPPVVPHEEAYLPRRFVAEDEDVPFVDGVGVAHHRDGRKHVHSVSAVRRSRHKMQAPPGECLKDLVLVGSRLIHGSPPFPSSEGGHGRRLSAPSWRFPQEAAS